MSALLQSNLTGLNVRFTRMVVQERRKERRYPTQDPVEVNLLPPDKGIIPATVIDVSRSGVRLECAHPIPNFAKIELIFIATGIVAVGNVRHCRPVDYLFQAGVFVEDIIAATDYAAAHLTVDEVAKFVQGRGLTTRQVFRFERHRLMCGHCEQAINDATKAIHMPRFQPAVAEPGLY